MLAEMWRYWSTFAPERVRKHGYLKRLIALEFRYKRNEDAWADHVLNCRTFIVNAAEKCPKMGTAVVLGSGLLIEIPLRSLAERFERVYLVDMFHMPQVRAEAKNFFNVKLLSGDITGIFAMMKEGEYPGGSVPAPHARIPHLRDADLIVSANCLTQLAPPFCKLLEKERYLTEFDQDRLTLQIQQAHVHAIAEQAKGVGAIITDTEKYVLAGNRTVKRSDLLPGLTFPQTNTHTHNLEWQWIIAPAGEEHETHDIEHTVVTKLYERYVPEDDEETEDGLEEDEAAGEESEASAGDESADNDLGDGLEDI